MLNGTRVLVTGGKGFIGSHIIEKLTPKVAHVDSYDIVDNEDILNLNLLESAVKFKLFGKTNWIVHLAGQVFLQPSLKNPQKDAMTNIIGILNVLEVARKHNCGVVFSSSGAVYGNNYQYPEPISPYGVSKLTAERYCHLYNKLYGLHTVIFRFSSVYGKGRKKTSVNLILDKALKEETITITGDGSQTRDFTHVSDVAEAIVMAVNGEFPAGVYDIGTGVSTSIYELITLISQLLDKPIDLTWVPAIEADPKRNELNVSKAARYGFKAKVSLVEGLKQLIEEMK